MKSLIGKIIIAAAGLVLATAPLAASARSWHAHGNADRGGYARRGGYQRGGVQYDVGYAQPAYPQPYVNAYFGCAPGGFQGYFWNGNWYHHRRWRGGVWIYF